MSEPTPVPGPLPPPSRHEGAGLAAGSVAAAAFLFGTTFLVVQDAVERTEPTVFLAARFGLATLVLVPFASRRPRRPGEGRAGAAAGVALVAGYVLQTVGLQYTESAVSAFITYLLVVIVPVLSAVVWRRLPERAVIVGVVLAAVGVAVLTGGRIGFGVGEALTVGCAFAFAVHILVLAHFAPRHDVLRLTVWQLGVVAALLLVPGVVQGGYAMPASVWLAALYTGVVVTAGAFVLQVWGQRRLGPTRTALTLTLEPVFAALIGWVAGEQLGWRTALGASAIVGGFVCAELPGLAAARSARRESGAASRDEVT